MDFFLRVTGEPGDKDYCVASLQKLQAETGVEVIEDYDAALSAILDEAGEPRLIIANGERVGFVATNRREFDAGKNRGLFSLLWIEPEHRRNGYGFTAVLHCLKGLGFREWLAKTPRTEAAKKLFEKHGFQEFDENYLIRRIDDGSEMPCIHRGEDIANIYCKPCKSKTGRGRMVTVFDCELHNACTLNNEFVRYNKKRCVACSTCDDRKAVDDRFRLDIGMACFDDYAGVWFTIQAMRLEILANNIPAKVRFIIIDNNPGGAHGKLLEDFARQAEEIDYVPYAERQGTSGPRNEVFVRSDAEAVVCVDSHILLWPGWIQRLVEFYQANPETNDLFQGLLLWDNLIPERGASHMDPENWGANMWGKWAGDERAHNLDGEPFAIPMQGLWLFTCRREAWLGFNEHQRGFGSEEGYIHEKFRQAGRKTLCLPFIRGVHKFGKPNGVVYPNNLPDICRNYVISHYELGLPMEPIRKHFVDELNLAADMFELFIAEARRIYDDKS